MDVIAELALPYSPAQLAEKLAKRRRKLRGRLISFAITVVVVVGLYLWQRSRTSGPGLIVISAVVIGLSAAWALGYLLAYLRVRRELASVGTGLAVRVGRPGVQVAGLFARWPEVVSLRVVSGGLSRAPRLRLTRADGQQASVPLDQIEVFPATLDSTVRAYSSGRHGVDLEALDS